MTTDLTTRNGVAGAIESVLIAGDLAQLSEEQRVTYYMRVCESVGLNPLTKPFDYLRLNGRTVLYARKDATDQLRALHGVSVVEMSESERDGAYIVTCKVEAGDGRTDIAKGAVNIAGFKGDNLANAIMKAETKAKRRATLSICGLGMLDEVEIETIPTEAIDAPAPRRTNVIINEATGKKIDTENARNQRPEWVKFEDRINGFVDARDSDGLRLWFTATTPEPGKKLSMAEFVAGWVFKDDAHECFEKALERIEDLEKAQA